MQRLNEAGINAGVICAPVLPGITDSAPDLEALVRATAEAGGKYIYANPLFLKPCSAAVFMPFLEQQFPKLVATYRQRFAQRAFLPKTYHKRISALMASLRKKYGMSRHYERSSRDTHPAPEQESGVQLALF